MWHWRGECSLCASSAFRQRAAAVLLQTSRFSLFPFFLARGGGDLSRSQLRATFFPRCSDLFFKEKKKISGSLAVWGTFPRQPLLSPRPGFPPTWTGAAAFLVFPPICTFPRAAREWKGSSSIRHASTQAGAWGCGTRGGRPARFAPSFVCVWKGSTARFPLKIMKYGTSFVLFV